MHWATHKPTLWEAFQPRTNHLLLDSLTNKAGSRFRDYPGAQLPQWLSLDCYPGELVIRGLSRWFILGWSWVIGASREDVPQVAMSSAAALLHHGTLRDRVDIPLADVQAHNKNMCDISVIFYPYFPQNGWGDEVYDPINFVFLRGPPDPL